MRQAVCILLALLLYIVCPTQPEALEVSTVRTLSGLIVGAVSGPADVYKGIPYTAAPTGERRWMPPAPIPSWTAPREASAFGAICPQPSRPDGVVAVGAAMLPQSEDCLTLNIWAPKKATKAPVMVWIHGGASLFGSGAGEIYDGINFARDGIVLVTFNYRLGALGYFAHPAMTAAVGPSEPLGNYGLMDQIAALRWVQQNIAAFGGNPQNVTVFGESSGGSSVLALLATPSARGLFARAICESGGGWQRLANLNEEEQNGVALATRAGLPGADATLAQLRALPAKKLLGITKRIGVIGPFPDGRLIRETPQAAFEAGHELPVPLLIGSNSYEASLLNLLPVPTSVLMAQMTPMQRKLYAHLPSDEARVQQAYTDNVFGAPAHWLARMHAHVAPSYLYYFSYVDDAKRAILPGAPHGSEIAYVFENLNKLPDASAITDQDRMMARRLHAAWVSFAKSGDPNGTGQSGWPAVSASKDGAFEFDVVSRYRPNFRSEIYGVLEKEHGVAH